MPTHERLRKNAIFGVVVIYYLLGYFILNEFTALRTTVHHLDFGFEARLPLLPALIFAYILEFAFMALPYLMIDDLEFFKKVALAMMVCITMHFAIFLAFPVEYNLRPAVDPDQGWAYLLVHFYYWLDKPYNCFPSMHVSNVFLIAFIMRKFRKFYGYILFPLAALVALSVVFVKQHFIADVISGGFVAWFVYRQVFRTDKTYGLIPPAQQGASK